MSVNKKASNPYYIQVYEHLLSAIKSSQYARGSMLPSEKDLAHQYGVQRQTVRRALEILVNEGIVEKRAGVGTRVKDLTGESSHKFVRSRNIVFVLPRSPHSIDRITESSHAQFFHSLEAQCNMRGLNLIYRTIGSQEDLPADDADSVSGFIFVSKIGNEIYEKARASKRPAVVVGNDSCSFPTIDSGADHAAYSAVQYLLELGHRHIGFITGAPGYYTSAKLLSGYKRCLTDANIDWKDQMIETGDWTFLGGYKAMRKMMGEDPEKRTTAIFAANDMTAMGAMEAIKAAGFSVPKSYSVVGYNDIEQCKYSNPTLTTTKTDYPLLAKVTLQILMDQVESGEIDHFRIEIPTSLIVRESAAAARGT